MSTIIHHLNAWAKSVPDSPAQIFKKDHQWKTITAKEFRDRVFYMALFLESEGFKRDDTVSILSYNCPEWVHCDLAPHLLGGKSAGLYPNSSLKDIHYVLEHTESSILVIQNKDYYNKILGKNNEKSLPAGIKLIVVVDGDTQFKTNVKVIAYTDAVEAGKKLAAGKKLEDYLGGMDKDAGAFLIYTSGTTGNPKGALISHDNLVFTSNFISNHWELPQTGTLLSFLPLCHIAEKLQNIGVGITRRYVVNYCSAFDNLMSELPEIQPTLLLSVPRLWEKMMEGVNTKISQASPLRKKLALWAMKVTADHFEKNLRGEPLGLTDVIQEKIARKLVISKIRNAMGLGVDVQCASGAAALSPTVVKWFRGLGVDIAECYGQTETTGVITMTIRGKDGSGTVGVPGPGTEVKLMEDGEILARGRHVFKGYLKNNKATEDTIRNGWVHTGDLGKKTAEGYIKIIGRKKEIMKSSGGKMIAPQPIEENLKMESMISQVCMVGDGKRYFTALITLDELTLTGLQSKNGSEAQNESVVDKEVLSQVSERVDRLNTKLAGYEKIKYFKVLSEEFSIDKGEMTPTLKMKRNIIEQNYKHLIEAMYGILWFTLWI